MAKNVALTSVALLSIFCICKTAHAQRFDAESTLSYYKNRYYANGLGRFLSRDPIGYRAEDENLYEYANSKATVRRDSIGLLSDQECCDTALKMKIDQGDIGGGICCEGRMVPCVWKPSKGDGAEIINECTLEHEKAHIKNDSKCPADCGNNIVRTEFKTPGTWGVKEECSAYTTQLNCLNSKEKDCKTEQCKSNLDKQRKFVTDRMKTYCPSQDTEPKKPNAEK